MDVVSIMQVLQSAFYVDNGLPIQGALVFAVAYGVKLGIQNGVKYAIETWLKYHPNLVTQEQLEKHVIDTKKFVTDVIAYSEFKKGVAKVPNPDLPTIIDPTVKKPI